MSALDVQVRDLTENQNHILEAIKYLDERIQDILGKAECDKIKEVNNILESQAMIDQIIVQNSDAIHALKKAKDENDNAIKQLDAKIDNINKEMEMTEKIISEKEDMVKNMEVKVDNIDKEMKMTKKLIGEKGDMVKKSKVKQGSAHLVTCTLCNEIFNRIVDLEKHIQCSHENREVFQCDQCGKAFTLRWRLKKHTSLHGNKEIRACHYFNNKKECPFEEFGCKLQHVAAKECIFGLRCNNKLCPYRHSKDESDAFHDTKMENAESVMEDSEYIVEKGSFATSTPQKRKFDCKECLNDTQCTDCFVRETLASSHSVHFSDE